MRTSYEIMISPPILKLPYAGGHYVLDTDVCYVQSWLYAIPKSIQQDQKTSTLLVSISFKTKKDIRHNPARRRECSAVIRLVLLQWPCLDGCRFSVRMYHDFPRWKLYPTDVSMQLDKLQLRLVELDLDVVFGSVLNIKLLMRCHDFQQAEPTRHGQKKASQWW